MTRPPQMKDQMMDDARARDELCRLIEAKAPRYDPDTGIPIGSEVESLADAILALARPAPDDAVAAAAFPREAVARLALKAMFNLMYDRESLCDEAERLFSAVNPKVTRAVKFADDLAELLAKAPVSEDVIQADRDAAFGYYLYTRSLRSDDYRAIEWKKSLDRGERDDSEIVQAFRRHRLGLTTEREDG